MSEHVSLAECREIARILRASGVDARPDGQEACACCPEEVWSVVVDMLCFTDENDAWCGIDARTGTTIELGIARKSPAEHVAAAIAHGIAALSAARAAVSPS